MNEVFYISSAVAVVSTLAAVTGVNAVHSLLYLIVSFLAVALVFFTLGAPVIAALEVIIYAGAIMVLFVFVVMILNLGPESVRQEKRWLNRGDVGRARAFLSLCWSRKWSTCCSSNSSELSSGAANRAAGAGRRLFGPYLLGVELASLRAAGGPRRRVPPGPPPVARGKTATSRRTVRIDIAASAPPNWHLRIRRS